MNALILVLDLTGDSQSVYESHTPACDPKKIFELGIPVRGKT